MLFVNTAAISWAFEAGIAGNLPPDDRLILLALCRYASDRGQAWPRRETLLKDTGLKLWALQAGLARLTAAGYIEDTGTRQGRTGQIPIRYITGHRTDWRLAADAGRPAAAAAADKGNPAADIPGGGQIGFLPVDTAAEESTPPPTRTAADEQRHQYFRRLATAPLGRKNAAGEYVDDISDAAIAERRLTGEQQRIEHEYARERRPIDGRRGRSGRRRR